MPTQYVAYKTELKLNDKQRQLCRRHAGVARWAYNWSLELRNRHYQETGESWTHIDLHREIVRLKRTDPSYSWLKKVSSSCYRGSFRNLDQAFKNFFRSVKDGRGRANHPKFKKRKVGAGSFRLEGCIHVHHNRIQLPRLGVLRLKERGYIPTDEKPLYAVVSEKAGRWFCSVKLRREVPEPVISENQAGKTVGADVGFRNVAVLSDGTVHESHHYHRRQLGRLRLLNKAVSRKQKGSQNWKKAMLHLRRLHYRIACQRNDQLHKISTALIRQYGTIGIETLNVRGMHRNKRLSKTAHDSALYEFSRQVEYKAERAGVTVVKAPMFYPSSQLCSRCGEQHRELDLRDSIFVCPACDFRLDRDLNAARNLKNLAAGAVVTACGDSVSLGSFPQQQSMKQEVGGA